MPGLWTPAPTRSTSQLVGVLNQGHFQLLESHSLQVGCISLYAQLPPSVSAITTQQIKETNLVEVLWMINLRPRHEVQCGRSLKYIVVISCDMLLTPLTSGKGQQWGSDSSESLRAQVQLYGAS